MGNGSSYKEAKFGNYVQEDSAFGVKLLESKTGQRNNPRYSHTADTMV